MKKINLFIALWMLIASYSRAQCFGNEGCTDGTTTDVTQPCPATNDFHKNTFDWTFPNIRSIDKSAFTAFAPFNPGQYLGNPFYTSGSQEYMRYIAYGTGSDFQPADGWELVKQDFGYYYDATANKWDGTTIASQSGVSGPHYGVDNGSLACALARVPRV